MPQHVDKEQPGVNEHKTSAFEGIREIPRWRLVTETLVILAALITIIECIIHHLFG